MNHSLLANVEVNPYRSIDGVRFWSMLAIVFEHCFMTIFLPTLDGFNTFSIFWVQVCKFGTIDFFLISGLLVGKVTTSGRMNYLKRRAESIVVPWLIWVSIYSISIIAWLYVKYDKLEVLDKIFKSVFYSAYWFVFIYFFSLSIFLALRKYLMLIYPVFLAGSIFYSINLYYRWTITEHTTALFGYLTYLFLGFFIYNNFEIIKRWLIKIPMPLIIVLILCSYFLSVSESWILFNKFHSKDYLNSLRISNQIYSVLIFCFMLKISHLWYPKILNPRKMTLGIYLTHPLVLLITTAVLKRVMALYFHQHQSQVYQFVSDHMRTQYLLLLMLIFFYCVYFGSYALILLLSWLNLGASVGIEPGESNKPK